MVNVWKYFIVVIVEMALVDICAMKNSDIHDELTSPASTTPRDATRQANTHRRYPRKRHHRKKVHKDMRMLSRSGLFDRNSPKSTKKQSMRTRKNKGAARNNKSCCQNGGQCVLGSFCVCPKQFFGRYCQFELDKANCGPVLHLGWAKEGCNLCYCYDGKMACLSRVFGHCGPGTNLTTTNKDREIFQPQKDMREDYPYLNSDDVEEDYYSFDDVYSSGGRLQGILAHGSWFLFVIYGHVITNSGLL